MKENNLLSDDVDLDELSNQTKNYSGAELEALVKSANSFALNSQLDLGNVTKKIELNNLAIV